MTSEISGATPKYDRLAVPYRWYLAFNFRKSTLTIWDRFEWQRNFRRKILFRKRCPPVVSSASSTEIPSLSFRIMYIDSPTELTKHRARCIRKYPMNDCSIESRSIAGLPNNTSRMSEPKVASRSMDQSSWALDKTTHVTLNARYFEHAHARSRRHKMTRHAARSLRQPTITP